MNDYILEINLFVKVRISHQDPHSWDALYEAYEIVKNALNKDERIKQIATEGIHSIEVDKPGGVDYARGE